MTQDALAAACGGKIHVPAPDGARIAAGYASDMLSDVMAHAPDDSVLVTIQNHVNTIAVCTLAGIRCVVVCHNRPVPEDMAKAALSEGVGIIATGLSQFEASCAIGKALEGAVGA
ncbi:MAG: hypothetical protein ACOX9C_04890 [Kiritimatiellia bacterium]|jgi:hypothetical protein